MILATISLYFPTFLQKGRIHGLTCAVMCIDSDSVLNLEQQRELDIIILFKLQLK